MPLNAGRLPFATPQPYHLAGAASHPWQRASRRIVPRERADARGVGRVTGGEAAMISRMTVAAVLLASGALVGGCASGPMASLDPLPSLAISAEGQGMRFPDLRGVVPEHAPRSAGEAIQPP